TYNITVPASIANLQNVASSVTQTIRMEIFPVPSFLSPQTGTLTDTAIYITVIQWPLPLQILYELPVFNWLSGLPLQGTSAQAHTSLLGEVQWQGRAYPDALITAIAYNDQQ